MANVQHNALTDPNIHEPKGISTATEGKVYVSNGSGSGTWQLPSGHSHGELYITGGTVSQTLPAASGTAILNPTSAWSAGSSHHMTLLPASGTLTITDGGLYQLSFYVIFTTAAIASGAQYNFHYAINGTHSTRKLYNVKTTNNVDTIHVTGSGLVPLADNDILSIYVGGDATSSSTAIVVKEAGIQALLVDPT